MAQGDQTAGNHAFRDSFDSTAHWRFGRSLQFEAGRQAGYGYGMRHAILLTTIVLAACASAQTQVTPRGDNAFEIKVENGAIGTSEALRAAMTREADARCPGGFAVLNERPHNDGYGGRTYTVRCN
jgi:hypothetical protein